MSTAPRPDSDGDSTTTPPAPALEVVGDLDVGACVDDVCGVPSLVADAGDPRPLGPGDEHD